MPWVAGVSLRGWRASLPLTGCGYLSPRVLAALYGLRLLSTACGLSLFMGYGLLSLRVRVVFFSYGLRASNSSRLNPLRRLDRLCCLRRPRHLRRLPRLDCLHHRNYLNRLYHRNHFDCDRCLASIPSAASMASAASIASATSLSYRQRVGLPSLIARR
jgi:hypothetical protein